ncbi:ARL2_Bind_BART domain-containing protein, partial [Haematococcus lacustris]
MMLDEKKDELMSDVFDLLLSLGDFEAFRELMLSYKRDAAGSSQGLQWALGPTASDPEWMGLWQVPCSLGPHPSTMQSWAACCLAAPGVA